MAWRLIATKGFIRRESGAKNKKVIDLAAKRFRKDGYKVKVYEVK